MWRAIAQFVCYTTEPYFDEGGVNAVILNRSNVWMFVAVSAVLAAMGCSDDAMNVGPVGTGGTGAAAGSMAPAAGTTAAAAGTTAAAAGTTAAAAGTTATAAGTGATTAGTGAGVAGTGMTGGTAGTGTSGAAPTLTEVYDMVYVTNCAVCHGMAPSDNTNGKLGMIRGKQAFYDALVNKPTQGVQCTGKGMYIVPGNPAMSVLVQKVSSTPPCGVEMPVGGMLQPAEVKMLTDWIMAGAMNN
jgi:hypothetical protein